VDRYDHWLDTFARYLGRNLRGQDSVVMVEHIRDMDVGAAERIAEHVGLERFSYLRAETPTTEGVPEFFAAYDQCDVVISARKHGVWIPAGKRIPTLGFGSVPEVAWTLGSVGMGHFHIDPTDLELWPSLSRMKLHHALRAELVYDRMMAPLTAALRSFNAKVAGLVT
jgi:hypothetical protein